MTAADRPSVTDYPDADEVLDVIYEVGYAASSTVQRKLGLTFRQTEDVLAALGRYGIVGKAEDSRARKILVTRSEAEAILGMADPEAWAEGHRTGWEHCQDGNYGNDYWDDPTPNPYAAAAHAEMTTKTPPAEAGATADDAVEDAPGEQGGSSVPPCSPGGRAETTTGAIARVKGGASL